MLRSALWWALDLAAIAVAIGCILHFSRRRTVSCAWATRRAACTLETEDSLGRVDRSEIDGIRGAAYRDHAVVGLVTDASNKDESAFFGTRKIGLADEADAIRLQAFADDRVPERVTFTSGAAHPRWLTGGFLGALLAFAFVSRRARRRAREAAA